MGWDYADFTVTRNIQIKKKTADKRAAGCFLETSDKHYTRYYGVFDTMCEELQESANGFKNIKEVFRFFKSKFYTV